MSGVTSDENQRLLSQIPTIPDYRTIQQQGIKACQRKQSTLASPTNSRKSSQSVNSYPLWKTVPECGRWTSHKETTRGRWRNTEQIQREAMCPNKSIGCSSRD